MIMRVLQIRIYYTFFRKRDAGRQTTVVRGWDGDTNTIDTPRTRVRNSLNEFAGPSITVIREYIIVTAEALG